MWRTMVCAPATSDNKVTAKIRHIDVLRMNIGISALSWLGLVDTVHDHRNRPLGRQRRTFLPADDMATVVARKINSIIGNDEFFVRSVIVVGFVRRRIVRTAADP